MSSKIKIISFLLLSSIMIKTFSNQIPIYINAGYDCYDALNNKTIRIIKKQVGVNNISYTLEDKQDYLGSDSNSVHYIYKNIATIYYHPNYSTDAKKKIGFKVDGANKGLVFTFNKSKKKLVLDNDRNDFKFTIKGNKVEGIIKNGKDKILINLKCNAEP